MMNPRARHSRAVCTVMPASSVMPFEGLRCAINRSAGRAHMNDDQGSTDGAHTDDKQETRQLLLTQQQPQTAIAAAGNADVITKLLTNHTTVAGVLHERHAHSTSKQGHGQCQHLPFVLELLEQDKSNLVLCHTRPHLNTRCCSRPSPSSHRGSSGACRPTAPCAPCACAWPSCACPSPWLHAAPCAWPAWSCPCACACAPSGPCACSPAASCCLERSRLARSSATLSSHTEWSWGTQSWPWLWPWCAWPCMHKPSEGHTCSAGQ